MCIRPYKLTAFVFIITKTQNILEYYNKLTEVDCFIQHELVE